MPRAAVRGWLTESFPDSTGIPCDGDDDECVHVLRDPHPHPARAYGVTVSVYYEGGSAGDTALVTFDASSY
jgi:hypothetical protein